MKDKMRRYFGIILVFFIPIQIYLNNRLNRKINEKPVIAKVYEAEQKNLSELNKELSTLNNCIILNADKDNETWYIKLKLYGEPQEILKEMKKLEIYNIKNYTIKKNDTENYVIMYIYSNNLREYS